MSARRKPQAPAIDRIILDGLSEGDVADLRRRSDLEGEEFSGVDLGTLDLNAARLDAVRLDRVRAEDADFGSSRFTDVVASGLDLPALRATRTEWRDVSLSGRLGSVDAYDVNWRSVEFVDCKIGYLNLRGSQLLDVRFNNCQIDGLDLLDATWRRVAFANCRIGELNLGSSTLSDVDLRTSSLDLVVGIRHLAGVTISGEQLQLMAPLFADELKIHVTD